MKRMLRTVIVLLPFLVLSLFAWSAANEPASTWIDHGQTGDTTIIAPEPLEAITLFHHALAREDYPTAHRVMNSLKTLGSVHVRPWTHVMAATYNTTTSIDFGAPQLDPEELQRHIDNARNSFSTALIREQDTASDERLAALHAALGTTHLLEAQWKNEVEGDPLSAMGPASRGYNEMKQAYELDPTRMDALLGIAAYRFFKSNAFRFLTWTPFVKDERKESLDFMRQVIDTPGPSQPGAVTTLAWALIEMDRPEEAADVCQPWLEKLDNPRHLLEPCAKAYFVTEDWDNARIIYDLYLDEIRDAQTLNTERLLGALSRGVQTARKQQDWEAVARYCDEALSQPLTEDQWAQYSDFHDGFERYRKQADKKLDERGDN